jgi:hypothetical protein
MSTQNLENQKELKEKLLNTIRQHPHGMTKNEMVIQSGVNAEIVDFLLRTIIEQYPAHLHTDTQTQTVKYVIDTQKPRYKNSYKYWQKIQEIIILLLASFLAFGWFFITFPLMASLVFFWFAASIFHVFFNQGFSVGIKEYLIFWKGRKKEYLERSQRILSYIASQNYAITTAEIIQITGLSYQEASEEALWLMINYGGEPQVNEDGIIIFVFNDLKDSSGMKKKVHILASTEKMQPLHPYQHIPIGLIYSTESNPDDLPEVFTTKKYGIFAYQRLKLYTLRAFLSLTSILGIIFTAAIMYAPPLKPEEKDFVYVFAFGLSIIIITILLSVIVLIRWFKIQKPENEKIADFNARLLLQESVFEYLQQQPQAVISKAILLELWKQKELNANKHISSFQRRYVLWNLSEKKLDQFALDLSASPTITTSGEFAFDFSQIQAEIKASEQFRKTDN